MPKKSTENLWAVYDRYDDDVELLPTEAAAMKHAKKILMDIIAECGTGVSEEEATVYVGKFTKKVTAKMMDITYDIEEL